MKKVERYERALITIAEILNGNDKLAYKLWLILLPEAKKESARLLAYTNSNICDMEDMLQESYFALLRTLDKYTFTAYDSDNLYQFIAWYKNAIRAQTRKLRAVDRKPDPLLNAQSMEASAFDDGEKTNADLVPDPNSFLAFEDQIDYVFNSELKAARNPYFMGFPMILSSRFRESRLNPSIPIDSAIFRCAGVRSSILISSR